MATTTDPLLILRQAIKAKIPITYAAGEEPSSSLVAATHLVISPGHSIPKSTPTRYRKPGVSTSAEPASNPQDFFSVEAVYLAWLLRDAAGAEYMKQARENGLAVGFVSVTERKNVVDWLEGRIADHERIVPLVGKLCRICRWRIVLTSVAAAESTTPPGSPPRSSNKPAAASATPLRSAVAEPTASPSKRRYVADSQDVEVVKKIKQNEIELRDRNTVLRGIKSNVSPYYCNIFSPAHSDQSFNIEFFCHPYCLH